ncbi:nuclear receptor binding SET domain protein [Topomyia yanbarensis]|uniref:nuclear receptor binding SET domain protein n=1 Tax=Topomyia yanbarensis TaxID=2498891 RepID=UPI00273B438F|nr:nuclear receptor binding SET domain protein [Topomyia yanbarensis]
MGRKARIRKARPTQNNRKKGSPMKRSPKMNLDIEEMLESSVISTNDGTIRTRNGIKVGEQIQHTPKRCKSVPADVKKGMAESSNKSPIGQLVHFVSPLTRGKSNGSITKLRTQGERLQVLLKRLDPMDETGAMASKQCRSNLEPVKLLIELTKVDSHAYTENKQLQQPETLIVSKPSSLRAVRKKGRNIQTGPELMSDLVATPDVVTTMDTEIENVKSEAMILNIPIQSSTSAAMISPKAIEERLKSPDRSQYLLKQLESTLSPKLTEPKRETCRPVSRYGRIQKQKENSDYIPMNVAKFITKSSPKAKTIKIEPEETVVEPLSEPADVVISPSSEQLVDCDSKSLNIIKQITLESDTIGAAPVAEVSVFGANEPLPLHDTLTPCDADIPEPALEQNDVLTPSDVEISEPTVEQNDDNIDVEKVTSITSAIAEMEVDAVVSTDVLDTIAEVIPPVNSNSEIIGIDEIKIVDLNASFGASSNATEIVVQNQNESTPKSLGKETGVSSTNGASIDHEVENAEEKWSKGQLGWGALRSNTLHWPCMVSADPTDGRIVKIKKNKVQLSKIIHVTFFADNGRRSWIPESLLLTFIGLDEYKILVETKLKHLKSKLNKALQPQHQWMKAFEQMNDMLQHPIELRAQRFQAQLQIERDRPKQPLRKRAKSSSAGYHSNSLGDSFESKGKRRRSPTPESPAYEPISTSDIEPGFKRIKLEQEDPNLLRSTISRYFQSMTDGCDTLETASRTSSESDDTSELTGFDQEAYNHLLNMSRLYVFEGQTETNIDRKLQKYVHKICSLRMQSVNRGRNGRVSNRLRSQALRNSFLKFEMELGFGQHKKDLVPLGTSAPKVKKEPKTLEQLFIYNLEKNYLLKGVPRGFVCVVCYKPNDVSKCTRCYNFYHAACISIQSEVVTNELEKTVDSKAFVCPDCSAQKTPPCFVCQDQEEPLQNERKHRCAAPGCGKYYHFPCLRLFPQHKLTSTPNSSTLFCPYHTCHTCVSDDPRTNATKTKGQLIRCIKCPSSYHPDAKCIPAGSQLLSNTAMICPKHSLEVCSLNVTWCFLCCKGGSLICCETCPTAFHLECLKFIPPEGKYICEECESGRMPLYNEVVWAKYFNFRFWPAFIVPPPVIPDFMHRRQHEESDICILFFGSHDYGWINRRRIYLYQEGDSDSVSDRKQNGMLERYNEALREARIVHEMLQSKKAGEYAEQGDTTFKPPMYVKIRNNRYVPPLKAPSRMEDNICECKPSDSDPCGPFTNCLNRTLLIECDPKVCPARERCENQCFEKKQYPALAVKRIFHKGWGLVAQEDIRVGQFVIEYVGEVINNDELARRLQQKREQKDENWYFLTIDSELTIDAGPRGNLARFINHSCEPNCETLLWNVGGAQSVGLFAIKSIKAGDELTFNYNFESKSDEKKICHCDAPKCSGFIGAKYRPPVEEASSSTAKPRAKLGKSKTKNRRHSAHPTALASKKRKISQAYEKDAEHQAPVAETPSGTLDIKNEHSDAAGVNGDQPVAASS